MPDLANDLSGRTWNLMREDPDNPVKPGFVKISEISFEGYNAATDRCMLKDGRGVTIFEADGSTDLSPVTSAFGDHIWVWNLTLAELTTGKCIVHTM